MQDPEIKPSATVVLLRDTAEGLQTLLLLRNRKLSFGGGEWVFPGGKIEQGEMGAGRPIEEAERIAAVRECSEEAGIALQAATLQKYSHWITPDIMPKRFSTAFYLAALDSNAPVVIDNSEIVDYRWLSPGEALQQYQRGDILMMPPTFVSLCDFRRFNSASELLDASAQREPPLFEPRVVRQGDGACLLYHGDCAYDNCDIDLEGPRHRLLMQGPRYEYICELND